MVKYLARYLTGGPISDRRVLSHDGRTVTLIARTGTTHGGSEETEEVELSAAEFIRRWCLHVLPKGFTESGRFGGWSNHHRMRYLAECRQFLSDSVGTAAPAHDETDDTAQTGRACSTCGGVLEQLDRERRPSWRDLFRFDSADRPTWYRSWETSG